MSELLDLTKWIQNEKAKGLIDMRFSTHNINDSTVESFCAEVNQMLCAPSVPDFDLF